MLGMIKLGVGGTIVGGSIGGSAVYLKQHNWEIGSTGVVRFGRAVVAVGIYLNHHHRTE